ncbi:hypothetical protein [Hymenobacter terrenus]|uniref:hypothetical protein n=1 Tax=Hymenobacter terrenus TaxID=1629124 RepID=UPI000A7F352E|nr:hypothetical protein [Hymenobacter terrenus]
MPAPAPVLAGFAPRRATPHPNAGAPYLPVHLRRQSTPPDGLAYAVTSYWEERFGDRTRRDVLTQTLTVHAQEHLGYWVVTCEATPPIAVKPDRSALEQVLERLASLYQRLILRLTSDGRPIALLNHAEVLTTWEALRHELMQRSGGGTDDVTQLLIAGLDAKLQAPGPLLASLRYHYLYGTLFANCYEQLFESGVRYEQPQCFAHYFPGTDLWLTERLTVAAPPAPGRVALHCDGSLVEAGTDRAALAQSIDAAWAAAGMQADRPATAPTAVHAIYDATYDFDATSGWPVAAELSVRCRAGLDYHKEFFLHITQAL